MVRINLLKMRNLCAQNTVKRVKFSLSKPWRHKGEVEVYNSVWVRALVGLMHLGHKIGSLCPTLWYYVKGALFLYKSSIWPLYLHSQHSQGPKNMTTDMHVKKTLNVAGKGATSMFPNRDSKGRDTPSSEPMVYSFISICQNPQKEPSHEMWGRRTVTLHGAPHEWKASI
jgi:hypothetical protein